MRINLNQFFDDFEGNWLTQTNIYLLKNKNQKIYNCRIHITLASEDINISNKLNIFYHYKLNDLISREFSIIKTNNKQNQNNSPLKINKLDTRLKLICENFLRIDTQIKDKNLIYQEYLYTINKNLKISLGILKKVNNHSYIGIMTKSYIKV
uniref:Uncharacterized protein n=1 Tax=Dasyclonium flaccidum TaxID=2007274 RepID=A0A1Z1MKI6_9FLOR|nr:hypothetical protein [Dasyclonium flaccidum]ARW66610.1 hypothetical protein [Dasyclonium flaccidum]